MDISANIKNNLISRIQQTKDLDLLKSLQMFFDSSENSLFELSNKQSNSIEIGRNEIEKGDFIENDQAISELMADYCQLNTEY